MKKEFEYENLHVMYSEALACKDIHKCTSMDLSAVNVYDLFTSNNAKKFIRNYFNRSGKRIDKNPQFSKLYRMIDLITDFRARHTVSSFLLGISVKKSLHLNTKSWSRLYSTKTSEDSFGFFWSVICLLHDAGYHFENKSSAYLAEDKTVADFCKNHEITHSMLKTSKQASLIEKYYNYRIREHKKIDHGIAAGILVYDALMEISHYSKEHKENSFCGMTIRDSFDRFALEIAEAIALHNIWIATDKNKDTYDTHHLSELIPGKHDLIIYHKDEPLRFLLGLIDTMDPVKYFCNSEQKSKPSLSEHDVINGFSMAATYAHQRKLHICFDHQTFEAYSERMIQQNNWLGIDGHRLKNGELLLQIRKVDNTEKAAA